MPSKNDHNYIINKEGCWIFGKGKSYDNGHRPIIRRMGIGMTAARYFYLKYKGNIPKGYEIDHLCFNGRCVNPDHLEAVSHTENIRRRRISKMNYSKVKKIRLLYKTGKYLQIELAKIFGIDQPNISKIINYERWC